MTKEQRRFFKLMRMYQYNAWIDGVGCGECNS